jgi:hypothetical protein
MSDLVFSTPPAFSDLADSDIVANKALTDDAIQKISNNAKFSAVRPERIYLGHYKHGDTVPFPVSPVDGYAYSSGEVLFDFELYSTRAPGVGFISGVSTSPPIASTQSGNLLSWIADIDNTTGVVSLTTVYLKGVAIGPGVSISSNDGIVKVYAICQRTMTLGAIPSFLDIPEGTLVAAQPLRQGNSAGAYGLQDVSHNAKYGAVRHEAIFMGYWAGAYSVYNGAPGTPTTPPTSPIDGYVYSPAEVQYRALPFTTLAPAGTFANGQTTRPSIGAGTLATRLGVGPLYWLKGDVDDPSGIISSNVSYYLEGGAETIYPDGVFKIYAICQRDSSNALSSSLVIPGLAGTGLAGAGTGNSQNTGVPDPPVLGVKYNNSTDGMRYHILIGVDIPGPANGNPSPNNWNGQLEIDVEVSTDPTFATFPAGKSLGDPAVFANGIAQITTPTPFTVPFETNFPGVYYIRARIVNGVGASTWVDYNGGAGLATSILDNLTNDTGLCSATSVSLVVKTVTTDGLSGNQAQVQYRPPSTNGATYFGATVIGHTSGVLPTATTQDTGTNGKLTAGDNHLVDLTKSWTPAAWVGKYVVAFSPGRAGSPSYDYEGQIVMAKILSNTATSITFDIASQNLTWTLSNVKYYIVNDGDHFWQKVAFATPCELDNLISRTGGLVAADVRNFTFNPPELDLHYWLILYNVYGSGPIVGTSPAHAQFRGLTHGELGISSVQSDTIASGAVIASKLTDNAKGWSSDIVFTALSSAVVSWNSGTIKTSDGVTYSIVSGNTGTMSGLTYVYFDKTVSTTVLQVTTNYANVTGENVILLCVAKNTSDATQNAFFVPSVGVFGINETVIGPNSISTGKIQANSITTNLLQANSVTAAKISVATLDAISVNAGTITAGTFIGTTFETASSGGRVVIDSTNGFRAFNGGGTVITQIPISGGDIGKVLTTSVQGIGGGGLTVTNGGSTLLNITGSAFDFSLSAVSYLNISSSAVAVKGVNLTVDNGFGIAHAGASIAFGTNVDVFVGSNPAGRFTSTSSSVATNFWLLNNGSLTNVLLFDDGAGHNVLYV